MARQFSPNAPVRLAEHANHAVAHRIDRLTPLTMACGWRPSEPGVQMTAYEARARWLAFFCRGCWAK